MVFHWSKPSPSIEMRRLLSESWALGWPIILIMFFQFAIGITDVFVAGFLGTNVLAAVGYVSQLYFTLIILANGLTVGTVSMISQAFGAKSSQGIGNITVNSLMIGLFISGVLTIAVQLSPETIIRAAGMPDDIQELGTAFIKVFSLVLTPTYVMIITGGVLRASGRVRPAMVNSFVAALANIAGDLTLTFGLGPIPALGFIGIAWATAAAVTLGMMLNLGHILYDSAKFSFSIKGILQPRCIRNLLKLGIPTALQQTAWNAGTLVVYFLIARLETGQITALAAITAGVRVEAIVFLPVFALNMASAILTGNRLGAGDIEGARSGAKATSLLCFLILIVPAAAIFIAAPALAGILTSDRAVIEEMSRYLRINMLGMPFMAVGITLAGALQGAGDTLATMRIIFTGMWLIRIPLILAVIFVFKLGATGVWWSMTVSMILMCALLADRFRGDAWVKASIDKETKSMLWEACLDRRADRGSLSDKS